MFDLQPTRLFYHPIFTPYLTYCFPLTPISWTNPRMLMISVELRGGHRPALTQANPQEELRKCPLQHFSSMLPLSRLQTNTLKLKSFL